MKNEELIAQMSEHVDSVRELVSDVTSVFTRLVRKVSEDKYSEELARQYAIETIAKVANRGGDEPPWAPPRYRLPGERAGITGKLTITDFDSGKEVDLFVTLNFYPSGNPSELFVRQQKEGSTIGALLDALCTVVSIALQHGVPWEVMAAKLIRTRFPPTGWTRDDDYELRQVSSVLDYVFRWATKKIESQRAEEGA